ncbi:MAG: DUF2254 family protein [Candidatus Nanohaloarchaea archaeon]
MSNLPRSLLGLLLLPVALTVVGWYAGLASTGANIRFFLSALAGAQAGVLAIVFSVTVIGVQLVSGRYSPRMISLFVESRLLAFTFFVFVVSIAVDLWLMLFVGSPPGALAQTGVYAAAGLGVVATASLFVFIKQALYQSTPEGAIEAFLDDLTTSRYLDRVRRSVDDDIQRVHPMRPLYSLVMSALSNRERATAELGLEKYGEKCLDVAADIEEHDLYPEEREVARELFKPVLDEHLHDIALHAEEQDENKLVVEAVQFQRKLGAAGLQFDDDTISRQTVSGLVNVIRDSEVDRGEYIANDHGYRNLGELTVKAAMHPMPSVVRCASNRIGDLVPPDCTAGGICSRSSRFYGGAVRPPPRHAQRSAGRL